MSGLEDTARLSQPVSLTTIRTPLFFGFWEANAFTRSPQPLK